MKSRFLKIDLTCILYFWAYSLIKCTLTNAGSRYIFLLIHLFQENLAAPLIQFKFYFCILCGWGYKIPCTGSSIVLRLNLLYLILLKIPNKLEFPFVLNYIPLGSPQTANCSLSLSQICRPTPILNGEVQYNTSLLTDEYANFFGGYSVGTMANFSCNESYEREGPNSAICLDSQMWSPQPAETLAAGR